MTRPLEEIRWWKTTFGAEEIQSLTQAIRNERISQGPETAQFEEAFARALAVPYAVATTSGSVALLMALMALGIGPGDEVIVPNRTFIATAHAAILAGAKVVLADVRPDIPALDVAEVEKKITSRTRAVLPVHLCGRAVDMAALRKLARKHRLLVEDACQAMFSRNAAGFLGTQSDAGCFSLGVTKLISSGQGGMVVTRDRRTYERLKLVKNHGVADTFHARYRFLGFNFKFTDMLASIGLVQLGRAERRIAHVKAIYEKYVSGFRDLDAFPLRLIPVDTASGEVPLYVEALCRNRDRLQKFLADRGIQTRPFLPDLDRSPHLGQRGNFPKSRRFGREGLFLPSGADQPLENVDRVLECLRDFRKADRS